MGRRPRISFRFSNDIDPRSITEDSIDEDNIALSHRLNQLYHRLNPQQRNAAINMMESVGDKYFIDVVSNYNFTNGGDGLYGNDALEFVCDKLDTTPVILVGLIPSIGDLSFEELTVKKIKLLLQAYYLRELNDYLDTL